MPSNIELAQEAGELTDNEFVPSHWHVFESSKALDAFAALVEQRYRERLLGEKVEPVAWTSASELQGLDEKNPEASMFVSPGTVRRAGRPDAMVVGVPLYTAEQCAAMVEQAIDRLTGPDAKGPIEDASPAVLKATIRFWRSMAQPKPKRLTRKRVNAAIERHVGGTELSDGDYASMAGFANAIQDALGIKEQP